MVIFLKEKIKTKTQVTLNKREVDKLNKVLKEETAFGSPISRGAFITIALNYLYDAVENEETTYEKLLIKYNDLFGGA